MGDEEKQERQSEASNAGETPEERFKRLATLRVNNALKKIKLIGNLAGPAYRYSDEEVTKIIQGLKFAVEEVEEKFKKGRKKGPDFQL